MFSAVKKKIRFDRNEFSGAFGDIGTDLPLLIGLIIVSGLNPVNVFVVFGILQILSAFIYGIPMPLQPLKAVAAVAIAMGLSGEMVAHAGLLLGISMLILTLTGSIDFISKIVPNCVIRGIQFGLGIKLALIAVTVYIPSCEAPGILIAGLSIVFILLFSGNAKIPPILPVFIIGTLFGICLYQQHGFVPDIFNHLPPNKAPNSESLINLLPLIVLPQIALSIGNSLLATKKLVDDYFPRKPIPEKKLSMTYSIFNIIIPFFGGVPVCHGSGGLAGHYRFGARTGGSLVIYGFFLILMGIVFHNSVELILIVFPLPILGVVLLFEGAAIGRLVKKAGGGFDFSLAVMVGLACAFLEFGFISGLVLGTFAYSVYKHLWSITDAKS